MLEEAVSSNLVSFEDRTLIDFVSLSVLPSRRIAHQSWLGISVRLQRGHPCLVSEPESPLASGTEQ